MEQILLVGLDFGFLALEHYRCNVARSGLQ